MDNHTLLTDTNIEVKLRYDWTSTTNKVNAKFESLAWYPISSSRYLEVVLSRWTDKRRTPSEYFYNLADNSLINEIIRINRMYGTINLICFIGPAKNTVRNVINYNYVTNYRSLVEEGHQTWSLLTSYNRLKSIIANLSSIGRVNIIHQLPVEIYKKGAINNLVLNRFWLFDPVSSLALTEKESKILLSAIDSDYFDKGSKIILEEIAKKEGKDKSTIDRELKNAINKLIKVLFWQKGFQ